MVSFVGIEAPELVVELANLHPEITTMKFQEYTPHELGITDMLKKEQKISVATMIRHRPDANEYKIDVERKNITSENIRKLIAMSLTRGKALVLCSRVETENDETLHIPMLDFECAVLHENLNYIREFVKELGQTGAILESGRSYHYYGFELVPHDKWIGFMARTLLFTGFVDIRHIGHRILSREARLRLAKIEGSERYIQTPRVVSVVE